MFDRILTIDISLRKFIRFTFVCGLDKESCKKSINEAIDTEKMVTNGYSLREGVYENILVIRMTPMYYLENKEEAKLLINRMSDKFK